MGDSNVAAIKDKIAELQDKGYCILRAHLERPVVEACREAFWPLLLAYLDTHRHEPNRVPISVWKSLTAEQRSLPRFPVGN